jgi:hypothetical protein
LTSKKETIMKTLHLFSLALLLACATLCQSASAQGVAGGLVTIHTLQPGPQVIIGSAATPIPIDLDPTGPAWFKNVGDPFLNAPGPSIVTLTETIQNVGTEAWGDWHEFLFPAPSGLPPHFWTNVVGLSVNGNPIGFTATGLGGQTLDLFNFSQPVMPGDIFTIQKQLQVAGTANVSGAFLRISQYPTPHVPEPGTIMMAAMAISGLSLWRRRS